MGQQQLLLLVLGIVIVGLAVVVGIQAFGENQRKANADALVNDGVRIASDIQAWALKPAAFGGPATAGNFSTASFGTLGYQSSGGTYSNLNGDFTLAPAAGEVLISGTSNNLTPANTVSIRVCGTDPDDIRTAVGATAASC
jgi:hypothetical protein